MVTFSLPAGLLLATLQDATKPVLEQLEPPKRAAVVLAIFALVFTGLMLVVGVMIGGHWVRRMARQKPHTANPTPMFAAKPQASSAPAMDAATDASTGSTIQMDAASRETRLDHK